MRANVNDVTQAGFMNPDLTKAQYTILRRWVLTGEPGRCAGRSITSLLAAGMLGRNGPTPAAVALVQRREVGELMELGCVVDEWFTSSTVGRCRARAEEC